MTNKGTGCRDAPKPTLFDNVPPVALQIVMTYEGYSYLDAIDFVDDAGFVSLEGMPILE